MKIFESLKKRHSAYDLGKKSNLSNEDIVNLVKEASLLTPSAFNAQTQRAVVLFGEQSDAFWDITRDALREVAPEEGFEKTVEKLESFKAQGTILFYTNTKTTSDLQRNFPLYADNFPVWAQQENGMLQLVIWSALAEKGVGASLQHYNPVVDDAVAERFSINKDWKLLAQMPFGEASFDFNLKDKLSLDEVVKVFE